MLMVRPVIKMNAWRKRRSHIMVFFIFLISNIGGCLTPIGDPPLLMGFMRGVPFFWSLKLLPILIFNMIILLFIFAAEILGEIQAYYVQFPYWDTMLHTLNGFLCAAIGFSLLDILNRDERLAFKLSPVYLAVVAFCFSMTIGVLWEFFECFMDQMFLLDMQKDTIVHSIGSVMLDPAGGNTPVAIHDLFVNFIGAVVFSFIGYFYVKNRGKGWFAKRFIPKVLPESGAKK